MPENLRGPSGGKVCETCGLTRWEEKQVTGWIDSLRAENEEMREALTAIVNAEWPVDYDGIAYMPDYKGMARAGLSREQP